VFSTRPTANGRRIGTSLVGYNRKAASKILMRCLQKVSKQYGLLDYGESSTTGHLEDVGVGAVQKVLVTKLGLPGKSRFAEGPLDQIQVSLGQNSNQERASGPLFGGVAQALSGYRSDSSH
jgi:hypothetical protein